MYNFTADNFIGDVVVKELTILMGDWKHLFGVVCTNRPFLFITLLIWNIFQQIKI